MTQTPPDVAISSRPRRSSAMSQTEFDDSPSAFV